MKFLNVRILVYEFLITHKMKKSEIGTVMVKFDRFRLTFLNQALLHFLIHITCYIDIIDCLYFVIFVRLTIVLLELRPVLKSIRG